jgi:hypothetical protein
MQVRSKLFYSYVTFALLYAASLMAPRSISTLHKFELTATQYRLVSLTVLIPILFIWFAAFYGYNKLRIYSQMIKNTPDGEHVKHITTGIMILAFGLPVASIVSAATTMIGEQNPAFLDAGTIIKNYVSLLFPLIGFVFISRGARGLSVITKERPSYRAVNILAAIFIAIGVTYCYLILTSNNLDAIYHLPSWLIVATLVCPYLYTWYLGILAAFETHLYSRKAPGKLYRRTWNMLATGIGSIIVMQIAIQYIGTATVQLNDLKLARLLFIVYILLALLSIGYILVAIGAKRLQKIEEV